MDAPATPGGSSVQRRRAHCRYRFRYTYRFWVRAPNDHSAEHVWSHFEAPTRRSKIPRAQSGVSALILLSSAAVLGTLGLVFADLAFDYALETLRRVQ